MQLRWYQNEAIDSFFDYVRKGGRAGIAALPTGTGKSIVIAKVVEKVIKAKPHLNIMMLTHVKELIEQNANKLLDVWDTAPVGIYSAGLNKKQYMFPITFAGIQSAYNKPEIFNKINILIIDECHLVSHRDETMYVEFINQLKLKNPDLVILGLTATPYRMGLGLLTNGNIFDDIFYDITTMDHFVRLIEEGFLCEPISHRVESEMDLNGVKKIAGEFSEKSLDENLNRDEITRSIVKETFEKKGVRKKGISFCISIDHAENMTNLYNQIGISAICVHSEMEGDRDEAIKEYKDGKYEMLVNVGVLTTGFDCPEIDYMVIARPTESTSLWVQMLGRGTRPHPDKTDTLVLDYAGNIARLGPINDPLIPMPKGKGGGEAPIKLCPVCDSYEHASVKHCKQCGHEFPPPKVRIEKTFDTSGELIKRKNIPKIDILDVRDIWCDVKGSDLKLSIMCKNGDVIYMNIPFKKGHKYKYVADRQWMKFPFNTPVPDNINDAAKTISANKHLVKTVKVWKNKPIPNSTKRVKEVMAFNVEE